jgi:hypothetical protein
LAPTADVTEEVVSRSEYPPVAPIVIEDESFAAVEFESAIVGDGSWAAVRVEPARVAQHDMFSQEWDGAVMAAALPDFVGVGLEDRQGEDLDIPAYLRNV